MRWVVGGDDRCVLLCMGGVAQHALEMMLAYTRAYPNMHNHTYWYQPPMY